MLMIFGMIGRAMETGDKKKNFGCWILDVGLKKEIGGRRRETVGNDEGAKSECRINEEVRMTNGLGRRKTHGLRTHPTKNAGFKGQMDKRMTKIQCQK